MTHVVVVSGFAESLINFRGDLICDLKSQGCRITALAPSASDDQLQRIERLGAEFVSYDVKRNGLSVSSDLATLSQLKRQFRRLNPDIVLAYTIKPVVWSGIALSRNRSIRFFPMITGLGFAFHGDSLRRKLLRTLVTGLYRRSLRRAELVFFQNADNQETFRSGGLLGNKPSIVLPGSGINLTRFPQRPFKTGPITFLMIARLLGEKGVREYAEAAHEVKKRHPEVRFRLVGPTDPSPDAISEHEIAAWKTQGAIEYVGSLQDVSDELANCHVYVLPSYHEGLPRTVLEAMATGRPIITTNAPGCKETVENGKNGFLVETKSSSELIERTQWFLANQQAIEPMGLESRKIAEQRFSVDKVNQIILSKLLTSQPQGKGTFLTRFFASMPTQFTWRSRRQAS